MGTPPVPEPPGLGPMPMFGLSELPPAPAPPPFMPLPEPPEPPGICISGPEPTGPLGPEAAHRHVSGKRQARERLALRMVLVGVGAVRRRWGRRRTGAAGALARALARRGTRGRVVAALGAQLLALAEASRVVLEPGCGGGEQTSSGVNPRATPRAPRSAIGSVCGHGSVAGRGEQGHALVRLAADHARVVADGLAFDHPAASSRAERVAGQLAAGAGAAAGGAGAGAGAAGAHVGHGGIARDAAAGVLVGVASGLDGLAEATHGHHLREPMLRLACVHACAQCVWGKLVAVPQAIARVSVGEERQRTRHALAIRKRENILGWCVVGGGWTVACSRNRGGVSSVQPETCLLCNTPCRHTRYQ